MLSIITFVGVSYCTGFKVPVDILQTPVDDSNLFAQAIYRSRPVAVGVVLAQENAILSGRSMGFGGERFDEVFGFLDEESNIHNVSVRGVWHIDDLRPGNGSEITGTTIGIGHRTAVMNALNSIDLVRDPVQQESRGMLVFNQSEAIFASENCFEGEVRHVPFALTTWRVSGQILDAIWQVDMFDPSTGNTTIHGPFGYEDDSRLHLSTGRVVGVGLPLDVYAAIHRHISAITRIDGGNLDGRFTIHFDNCTAVRATLPDIGLNIYNMTGSPIGQIMFTPLEYTRLVGEEDRCRLWASPANGGTDAFEIDPFQLEGMNVRLNRTHFSFCDAL